MVYYCSVKSCKNNSSEKKLDGANNPITFHCFPSNAELKSKWLEAIGRAHWQCPSHARVCSAHFPEEQINRAQRRTRLRDDACPVGEMSAMATKMDLKVCRMCLITQVKMFSLQDDAFRNCLISFPVLNKNIDSLPQYSCFQCTAQLLKCHKFIEKCLTAKTTLLSLIAKSGQITSQSIVNVDRKTLNLQSDLTCHKVVPKVIIDLHYDEDLNTYAHTSTTKENLIENDIFITVSKDKIQLDTKDMLHCKAENNSIECVKDREVNALNAIPDELEGANVSDVDYDINDESYDSEEIVEKKQPPVRKAKARKRPEASAAETEMSLYYDVVQLTLEQQIEERERMKLSPAYRDALYRCETCYRGYMHPDAHRLHLDTHAESRGPAACAVCRARYRSAAQAAAHARRAHATRYRCRRCPRVLPNLRIAVRHHRKHEGHQYTCQQCDFTTVHESAHASHVQSAHGAPHACGQCGRRLASARGLARHRARHDAGPAAAPDGRLSGGEHGEMETRESLANASENASANERDTNAFADEHEYPRTCAHCPQRLASRREHYFHVRRAHPAQRAQYQPRIRAVCATCGKGFQNATKLHLHELRHGGAARVRCPHCPRVCYDKYQLARHAAAHSDARPHRCALCDKAFKLKSNLERHGKVHSGSANYACTVCGKHFRYSSSRNLHVRAVHLRQPPPRRRRPAAVTPAAAPDP